MNLENQIMKSFKISFLMAGVFALAFVFAGCQKTAYKNADLSNNIDSVSYSFGYLTGKQMKSRGMTTLKPNLMIAGLKKALSGDSSKISRTRMVALMRSYQSEARARMMKEKMAKAKENKKKAKDFLAQNKEKEGIKTTESGLQYKVIKEGDGASPSATDTVKVSYEGTLLNGEVFDSSYKRGQPATFPLNRVIEGWTEGIQLMKEGAVYKFWIPPSLGYGTNVRPNSPIGPNELLIFKVELLEVQQSE